MKLNSRRLTKRCYEGNDGSRLLYYKKGRFEERERQKDSISNNYLFKLNYNNNKNYKNNKYTKNNNY